MRRYEAHQLRTIRLLRRHILQMSNLGNNKAIKVGVIMKFRVVVHPAAEGGLGAEIPALEATFLKAKHRCLSRENL